MRKLNRLTYMLSRPVVHGTRDIFPEPLSVSLLSVHKQRRSFAVLCKNRLTRIAGIICLTITLKCTIVMWKSISLGYRSYITITKELSGNEHLISLYL